MFCRIKRIDPHRPIDVPGSKVRFYFEASWLSRINEP